MRLAFVGFRHGHIMGLYHAARAHPEVEVVAAIEDNRQTRETLLREGKVQLTNGVFTEILQQVPCDTVAIGDYFARRGEIAIAALEAGKHVIADKPICTRLDE